MNILVLHALGKPSLASRLLFEHVFSIREFFPEHCYIFHDANIPPPDSIKNARYDAILLDVTFLAFRWRSKSVFGRILKEYAFVGNSDAVKIAFPQDEYDCHLVLDDWMCKWHVDVVFSVLSEAWDLIYPRYSKIGRIEFGYTGYIDERLISKEVKSFLERSIDIGYRANNLPANYGRIGQQKRIVGEEVARLSVGAGLAVDIKVGGGSMLAGEAWLSFLNNCKFTLGANSGSSLLDPVGDIRNAVRGYVAGHPKASFEEIEQACFSGQDVYEFTALSPRVFEAALMGSAQILVRGDYGGILVPYEHYLPIQADASDFSEILDAMRDYSAVRSMIARCRETLLSFDDLRYRRRAEILISLIIELRDGKGAVGSNPPDLSELAKEYASMMRWKYARHRFMQSIKKTLFCGIQRMPWLYRLLRALRYRLLG